MNVGQKFVFTYCFPKLKAILLLNFKFRNNEFTEWRDVTILFILGSSSRVSLNASGARKSIH